MLYWFDDLDVFTSNIDGSEAATLWSGVFDADTTGAPEGFTELATRAINESTDED